MKVICRISGVPVWKSPLLLGFDLADEHPIFKAKPSLVLTNKMIHRFGHATNTDEKRLIYLAILNTTNLIEFQVPAEPSLATMESTFYNIISIVPWLNAASWKLARIVSFPQYVVSKDNRTMDNVRSWLAAIEEIRQKVFKKELDRDKNAELMQRESEIKKELGDANFFGKAFTPKLARWSLELCDINADDPRYSKYMKLLCTPLNEAWIHRIQDYYEVKEALHVGLPNLDGNPQAISVMYQMNNLIKECKKGYTEFSMLEDDPAQVKDFEILEDSGEGETRIIKINQHLKDVPEDMPQEKQFAKKLDYLRAKAKWELAQRMKNRQNVGANDV